MFSFRRRERPLVGILSVRKTSEWIRKFHQRVHPQSGEE